MATGSMGEVVKYLRRAARPRGEDGPTDGQLLGSFLAHRDEAAFELLVRRHAVMVLGVCKRVLGNVHDAEDAFQATFLVLARRAASVVPREQVGNWLHGVALRTAVEARARRARRRARELQVTDMPHPTVPPDVDLHELHRLLDEELGRLPVKYRSGIILCDLEGRSRKEAARQLGVPEGTLSSRLAAGRQLLARRGLAVPAAALATALAAPAQAGVPPALLGSTAKVAVLAETGRAAAELVSANVVSLSQGVLKTMFLQKLKVVPVLVLAVALGGFGAGVLGLPGKTATIARGAQVTPTARGQQAEPQEPLDAGLLLSADVQKELRLSKNQVQRLRQAAADAERKNEPARKEIQQIREHIAQLQKQIERLESKIGADRDQAVRQVAHDALSPRAIQRLQQIQRQRRGPESVLKDPRVQRWLQLDDEQTMKIEKAITATGFYQLLQARDVTVGYRVDLVRYFSALDANPKAVSRLREILTDEQKQALRSWLGEPYRNSNWGWLWEKGAKKDR
jgi:RNA polymerase sigma factor (sigma-70 family)